MIKRNRKLIILSMLSYTYLNVQCAESVDQICKPASINEVAQQCAMLIETLVQQQSCSTLTLFYPWHFDEFGIKAKILPLKREYRTYGIICSLIHAEARKYNLLQDGYPKYIDEPSLIRLSHQSALLCFEKDNGEISHVMQDVLLSIYKRTLHQFMQGWNYSSPKIHGCHDSEMRDQRIWQFIGKYAPHNTSNECLRITYYPSLLLKYVASCFSMETHTFVNSENDFCGIWVKRTDLPQFLELTSLKVRYE